HWAFHLITTKNRLAGVTYGKETFVSVGYGIILQSARLFTDAPKLSIKVGDKQIVLTWSAVTAPGAAAKYKVSRGTSDAGTLTPIAESPGLTYADTGLINGTVYCYIVEAITADGKVGPASTPACAAPYFIAANHYIAYFTPGSTAGSQAFGGSLGM